MGIGKNKYYCRINGTIHNLEELEPYLNKERRDKIILKLYENFGIEATDALAFSEYVEANGFVIPPEWNTGMAHPDSELYRMQQEVKEMRKYSVKCPTCGSDYVRKLNIFERASWMTNKFNKTFECKNCGYTW